MKRKKYKATNLIPVNLNLILLIQTVSQKQLFKLGYEKPTTMMENNIIRKFCNNNVIVYYGSEVLLIYLSTVMIFIHQPLFFSH
jgi:hypothetical protein